MGFAEENADVLGGGGGFLTGAEKNDLMDKGIVFPIVGIEVRDNPFEEDEQQYVISVVLADDEAEDGESTRMLTYTAGAVESRDRLCDRLGKWLGDPANDPVLVRLTKVGRSQIVVPLSEDEIADFANGVKPAAKPAAKPKPAAAKRTTAKRTTAKAASTKK